jgi:hypothetical protein
VGSALPARYELLTNKTKKPAISAFALPGADSFVGLLLEALIHPPAVRSFSAVSLHPVKTCSRCTLAWIRPACLQALLVIIRELTVESTLYHTKEWLVTVLKLCGKLKLSIDL